jgi:Type I restriction enzyme R protein N terminus (HSDR_N)
MPMDIRKALKKFAPCLIEAREQALNEADTVMRLCKFFEDVLGYDGIADISREANFKSKFVDVCLKVDGAVRLLVEAKAAGVKLRDRHIEQAQSYASQNNYRWVILTNGVDWQLFHLTFDEGIEYERAFSVSLDSPEGFDAAVEKLAVLHKLSVKKGELESFWEKTAALSPASLGKVLFKESIILLLRREIRRDIGLLIDPEDLGRSLHEMLSLEAREIIGPMRIRRRRKERKRLVDAIDDAKASLDDDVGKSVIAPITVSVA